MQLAFQFKSYFCSRIMFRIAHKIASKLNGVQNVTQILHWWTSKNIACCMLGIHDVCAILSNCFPIVLRYGFHSPNHQEYPRYHVMSWKSRISTTHEFCPAWQKFTLLQESSIWSAVLPHTTIAGQTWLKLASSLKFWTTTSEQAHKPFVGE